VAHQRLGTDAADRSVAQILGAHRDRLLHPVASLSATKLLLQKHIPDGLPSNVGNACRALARQVMDVLEIEDSARDTPHPAHQDTPTPRHRPGPSRKLRQHRPSLTPHQGVLT
jgi:hypothetical protein